MKDLNQKNRLAHYKARYAIDFITILSVVFTAVILTAFVFLLIRAVDMWALQTCEIHGDCAEVIKHING